MALHLDPGLWQPDVADLAGEDGPFAAPVLDEERAGSLVHVDRANDVDGARGAVQLHVPAGRDLSGPPVLGVERAGPQPIDAAFQGPEERLEEGIDIDRAATRGGGGRSSSRQGRAGTRPAASSC